MTPRPEFVAGFALLDVPPSEVAVTEMTPAEAIFFTALDMPRVDRAAYLDAACAGDRDLRAHLEKMLAVQSEASGFLGDVPSRPVGGRSPASDDWVGVVVAGRYKLLQHVGDGGMGSVWMADQLAPVRRRVAVKLVRDDHGRSTGLLARFEAERQAIALMDHPHIARLLDAGMTDGTDASPLGAGRPYFVMELVKGVPLDRYCDDHRLTVPERLRLFVQICAAVQHAHQKGVIHRDLKPGNVLVESHDGKPVPRVIDFGLAKATGGVRLTDDTALTRLGAVAGTPQYMAPEQATFNALDVDTRADVYALGVILYELLTGTTPIGRDQLNRVAFEEVLRAIREAEPPTPSRRLSSADSAPDVAANRRTELPKLGRLVRGDLDWVVMKALAKERDRRYESAAGLAGDVERFLNHEPVLAGPPGAAYRLRKFVRRNRPQVIAGGLLALALLAGVAGTTFGLIRADRRRHDAEEAEFREANQRRNAERARDRTREALDAMTAAVAGDSLTTQTAISAEQAKFLAVVLAFYQDLAEDRGHDPAAAAAATFHAGLIEYRLGRIAAAADTFRLARDRYAWLVAESPAEPERRQQLGRSHSRLGLMSYFLGRHAEAEEEYRRAQTTLATLAGEFPARPEYREDLAVLHHNLGVLLIGLGKRPAARAEYDEALAIRRLLAAEFPSVPAYRHGLAMTHTNLAILLTASGARTAAAGQYRAALAIHEQLLADHPTVRTYRQDLGDTHNNLATLLNDPDHFRKAIAVREKLAADFPEVPTYRHDLANTCHSFGGYLQHERRLGDAEVQYRRAQGLQTQLAADVPAEPKYRHGQGSSHDSLGTVLRELPGKRPEAEEHFRNALGIRAKLAAEFPDEPGYRKNLADTGNNLATALKEIGQNTAAQDHYRQALAVRERLVADFPGVPAYRHDLGLAYLNFASLVRDAGRPEQSLAWFEKAISTLSAAVERDGTSLVARHQLGKSYEARANTRERLKQFAEAADDWGRAFELASTAEQPRIRAKRAFSRLNAGQVAGAMDDVAELSKGPNGDAGQWYDLACISAAASGRGGENKSQHAARAMDLLHRAVSAGFKDVPRMAKDTALDALRGREDFKKLQESLTKLPE